MPLTELAISDTKVSDLTPILGLKLTDLYCNDTMVADLTPLAAVKIKHFCFTPATVARGIEAVRRAESFETIGTHWTKRQPAAEFWERYDRGEFGNPPAAPN
jgi:hypothetical protein